MRNLKKAYKDTWDISSRKEDVFRRAVGANVVLVPTGFGAGSSEYLRGSSADHGHERSAPDFVVDGTNIFVEVTGPLKTMSDDRIRRGGLWVTVAKTEYARRHPDKKCWIAWMNGVGVGGCRMIRLGDAFERAVAAGEIKRREVRLRGPAERFMVVPASHECVVNLDVFIDEITK